MCIETNQTFLVQDEWTGRYFFSNVQELGQAVNAANSVVISEGDVDLNTLYEYMGLEPIPMGNDWGWSGDSVQLVYAGSLAGPGAPRGLAGTPCMIVRFRNEPKPSAGIR